MSENALVVAGTGALMPVMDLVQVAARYNYMKQLVSEMMVDGLHYGAIPGTDKPTLKKAGAEMLTTVFALVPKFDIADAVEQWNAAEPFFYYRVHCELYHNGVLVGEGDGSCNSRESRYRWRWVDEADVPEHLDKSVLKKRGGRTSEPQFAVERGQTDGKYGKPEEYWQAFRDAIEAGTAKEGARTSRDGRVMKTWEIDRTVYRVPNEDIYSQVNTILKMAEKRALVAATLVTVNASDFFTQDMEDLVEVPVTAAVINPTPSPEPPKPEPPTAKREWPDKITSAIVEAQIAAPKRHAESMLNLSDVLRTTDELELVLEWCKHYKSQRPPVGDKEPEQAARYADDQIRGVEGE
jgi:hypothetical protein